MQPERPDARMLFTLAWHLGLGAIGGLAASALGLPMPFLLGSLTIVAPVVIWQGARGIPTLRFPKLLRMSFIAVIGTLIGARFSPELMAKLPTIWISLIAVMVFVVVAHVLGYAVYRRVGKYDRVTALYGSMPGGLIEGVSLGQQAGGDPVLLTVHHFARIVIVVVTVPLLFFLLSGNVVGSASGSSLASVSAGPLDVAIIAVISGLGLWLGKRLKLPAGHLMGPLVLAAVLTATGILAANGPGWLVALAQLVVGTALATQFAGASVPILARAFGLTFVAVLGMMVITTVAALIISSVTVMSFDAAFISFAPGGVAEMGLIALSLDASPVIVAAHHLVRIVLTVVLVRVAHRRLLS